MIESVLAWLRSLDWGLIIPIVLLAIAAGCMVAGGLLSLRRKAMRSSE